MRRSAVVATLALISLSSGLGAHPHSYVDQQVQLSMGLDVIDVTMIIVPSAEEGAAIFAHLDSGADGILSPQEATDFGAALINGMRLEVDGQVVGLSEPVAEVAEAEEIRAGTGAIRVKATAPVSLAPDSAHQVVFDVTYGEFSHEWFVQPFYHPDLIKAFENPALERSPEGDQVIVWLSPP